MTTTQAATVPPFGLLLFEEIRADGSGLTEFIREVTLCPQRQVGVVGDRPVWSFAAATAATACNTEVDGKDAISVQTDNDD